MGTLSLYWNIGKQIIEKQEQIGWGKQVIAQLSKDLCSRFPDDRGYSERNLRNMKRFAEAYPTFPIWQVTLAKLESEGKEFVQVPLAQISWYHHISLLSKVKNELPNLWELHNTKQKNSLLMLHRHCHRLRK